jgi:F-type H+-transporting ATPase subunit b
MIVGILQSVPEHPIPALLDPKVGLFFFTVVVFLTVYFILRKFAWGPITAALENREETIDASIKRAETALAEARQISEDNQRARRDAEADAQRVLRRKTANWSRTSSRS